ncbi:MAG: ECF-type sigma factor [Pseudomonadota bacterium]
MSSQSPVSPGEVTQLLRAQAEGGEAALNHVVSLLYEELKTLAQSQLRRSSVRNELQTTSLVHEAFEKLSAANSAEFRNRGHFFAVACRVMRQIVIDTWRARMASKRGGGLQVESLHSNLLADLNDPHRVLRLDEALNQLEQDNEELAEVIDLSCFGGFSSAEIAELRGTSDRTVQRQLKRARAWVSHILENA